VANLEPRNRRKANVDLATLCSVYHNSIPIKEIDEILTRHNFRTTEEGIYCGREGRIHEQVGERTYLSMTWYKIDHRPVYEIVAYVS
jgi:hypothetical protein